MVSVAHYSPEAGLGFLFILLYGLDMAVEETVSLTEN